MKPPYAVSSMRSIKRSRRNGYRLVSTFSGAGGSCLGFRMAGFRTLWASEFIEAARETYAANFPMVPIDDRDIRDVTARALMRGAGVRKGELDVLEGSPPCASFSTAGRGAAHWGEVKKYSDTKQRTDDLFFEFARLVEGVQPKVFVAENVAGLVRGVAKGYFIEIFERLEAAGYAVAAKLLDAQWLGVPQHRERIFFIGVRSDLGVLPAFPQPLSYRYSIRDAVPWIVAAKRPSPKRTIWSGGPSPAVMQSGHHLSETARFLGGTYVEVDTRIEGFAIGDEYDRIKEGGISRRYTSLVKPKVDAPSPTVTQRGGVPSVAGVVHPTERRKFSITELKRICSFPDDFVLTGTFAQQWERLGRAVPPIMARSIAVTIRDEILAKL